MKTNMTNNNSSIHHSFFCKFSSLIDPLKDTKTDYILKFLEVTNNKLTSASSLWQQDKQEDPTAAMEALVWLLGACCLRWVLASGERDGKKS